MANDIDAQEQVQTARMWLIEHADRDETYETAISVLRAHYYRSIRRLASSIHEDAFERWQRGSEDFDECLSEAQHGTIDGCSWVIYTQQAYVAVLASDNHMAFEDYSDDSDCLPKIEIQAFYAILADTSEAMPSGSFVLMNGSSGCLPDNVERYDSPDEAIEAFKEAWADVEVDEDSALTFCTLESGDSKQSDMFLDVDAVAEVLRADGICYLPEGAGADYVSLTFEPESEEA